MSGEALVLLSGLGSDEDTWRDEVAALGGEPLVARGNSIAEMARDILARAPARFALAGHSMGGYVAIEIALVAPERISRLALVNTSAAADTPNQREARLRTIAVLESKGIGPLVRTIPPLMGGDPAVQARVAAMLERAGTERVLREQRACLARADRTAELGAIAAPTLVVGAADDLIVPPRGSRGLAQGIPGARLTMLRKAGHVTPMTRAATTVKLLQGWLAQA
jgi:pimeloyl-ACP methyl ester carboxylesterase